MTRIALLRHYQTDWNVEQRLQGRSDRPLTEEARQALARLALPPGWADLRVITSTLRRSIDTAAALSSAPSRQEPRLVEISWGDWEGHRAEDLAADPGAGFIPTGDLGWSDRPPGGGESRADAWARMQPALVQIAADPAPALLVLHKAVMRILLALAHGGPQAETPEIKRGRLYPLTLRPDGHPTDPGAEIRLVPR